MEFRRARNEEQKKIRMDQILAAAKELFDVLEYKDITLGMIADKLDFSRANMSRYIESKEEIFLRLYIQDMQKLVNELLKAFQKKKKIGIPEFAAEFAEICGAHTVFLRIGSILNTVIEMNISISRLAECKKLMFTEIQKAAGLLVSIFPFLQGESAFRFIMMFSGYAQGLYPTSNLSEAQAKAMELAGMPAFHGRFTEDLKEFIVLILNGYLNAEKF